MSMNEQEKLRRVRLLCLDFIINCAYYTSYGDAVKDGLNTGDPFWVVSANNSLDKAVLIWCILFGNDAEKLHWKTVVRDTSSFRTRMLETTRINQRALDNIQKSIIYYRNNFVAHLTSKTVMRIPNLKRGLPLVFFYYTEVNNICDAVRDPSPDISVDRIYKYFYNKGRDKYLDNNT